MKRKAIILAGVLACIALLSFSLLEGGRKGAYKHYYKGNYYYSEGRFDKAVYHFSQAYDAIPTEFNFALAYAVGLGRVGKTSDSQALLKRSIGLLSDKDPEYRQKTALLYFFEGVTYTYAKQYGQAVAALKKGISVQEELGKPTALSVMYNTLGYATFMNQGQGAHKSQDRPLHYHLRKDDLQRAYDIFKLALQQDSRNETAWTNQRLLGDTLDVPPAFFDTVYNAIEITDYDNLPNNTSEMAAFANYEEVVMLLDISGSMVMENVTCRGATRFQVMKETALFMLDKMAPTTLVGVGTIGGDCGTPPKMWQKAGSLPVTELRSRLGFLNPDGTTPLLNMLVESPGLFTDNPNSRKSLLLVSDGANICKVNNLDICEWSQELREKGITINVLSFLNADLENTNAFAEYTCLADNTYGKVLYIDALNCRITPFTFTLLEATRLRIPPIKRVQCWGPAFKELWAIYPE
ncbi:MAG: VWA domain-containing protein [Saprospiraceae bacterium]|nr:VWA domain-containing protein [Saprospiraceae bacterium]